MHPLAHLDHEPSVTVQHVLLQKVYGVQERHHHVHLSRKLEEVRDDARTRLLNEDTGDTLNGVQFKRALVRDYLTGRGARARYSLTGRADTVSDIMFTHAA